MKKLKKIGKQERTNAEKRKNGETKKRKITVPQTLDH